MVIDWAQLPFPHIESNCENPKRNCALPPLTEPTLLAIFEEKCL